MTDANPPRRRAPARAPHRDRALPRALLALLGLVVLLTLGGTIAAVPPGAAAAGPDAGIRPRARRPVAVSHEVYGYLPYWRLDAGTVHRLDFGTMSTIAFFAVPIAGNGALDTRAAGLT
jgi:hypothetical protein